MANMPYPNTIIMQQAAQRKRSERTRCYKGPDGSAMEQVMQPRPDAAAATAASTNISQDAGDLLRRIRSVFRLR
ncbi:MAG: hypothetical protein ACKVH0_11040 [Alphaproteobacteria bacterium]